MNVFDGCNLLIFFGIAKCLSARQNAHATMQAGVRGIADSVFHKDRGKAGKDLRRCRLAPQYHETCLEYDETTGGKRMETSWHWRMARFGSL